MENIRRFFAAPVFEDEDKNRTAYYLNLVSLSAIGVLVLYLIVSNLATSEFNLSTLDYILLGFIGLLFAARYAMTKGYVQSASHVVVGLIWLGLAFQAQSSEGIRDATFFAFFVVILMASLLLGTRAMFFYSVLSIIMGFGLVYLENNRGIEITLDSPQHFARDIAFIFILFAIFQYLVTSSLGSALKRARSTAQELHKSNEELLDLRADLESRVADRTKALATAAEVGRRLSAVTNPRQLAVEVVEQVQRAFDYYYAQIYLMDEAGENLVLTGGTGEAGAAMLARGHSLQKGRGLVGRAAETNASVLIPDVSQEAGWLPNELLPETKAEASVPISVGNRVLGVLDVQHNVVNGLTDADVTLLESLASQAAISLQNARTYEQSRKQAELESVVNVIGQKIQRTTTIEDTLQTAIRELGTAVGAVRVKASLHPASSAVPVESPVIVLERDDLPGNDNSNDLAA